MAHPDWTRTHDATATKFNLRGNDITAAQLGKAIADTHSRWVIVDCSSCSAPFLQQLSGPNRVVITATKSGAERNYSRFGDFFSQALGDAAADLDHDRSVSVLEAFFGGLWQSRRVLPRPGSLGDGTSLAR